jgi:putative MATE family efflux protein
MRTLTEGSEARVIWSFAVPMLIGNIFQQLYNLTDAWVVGRFVGKEALAAVGSSFSIIFLLVALIIGATMGSGILVSQFFGARDLEKVRRILSTTYLYVFWAAIAMTAIGLVVTRPLLVLLHTPADVLPQATAYLQIMFAGTVLMFGYNAFSAVLRALGDSRTPLYFLITAVVLNVGLDILFVAGLGWGVAGAAWATVISQGVAFAAGWVYMQRSGHDILRIDLRHMVFDRHLFGQAMRIGLPSAVQQTLVAMGFMALQRIVNGFGTDAVAAYTAAGRLDSFAAMPAMNFSMALVTFVGQNLGAGKPERVKKGFLATLMMSGAIAVATTLAMVFFKVPLIRMFNADPAVVEIGSRYLLIVGSFYILFSTMFVSGSVPRGAGDTVFPMLVTLLSLWVVRVPLSIFLSRSMGTDGVWWSMPMAWGLGAALNVGYYFTGRWRRMSLVRRGPPAGGAGMPAVLPEPPAD